MPTISVITAVQPERARHLPEAWESLRAQEALPAGWEWEWVVQQDGFDGGALLASLPTDPRIEAASGRPGGPAVARNLGLARSRGSLVRVLDADDVLTPGALRRDVATMVERPRVGWCVSRVLDLLPDGTTAEFPDNPRPGRLAPGSVFDDWLLHDHVASVHPASLCVRRGLLVELGGWMALPASEDTGLVMALNVVSDGWFTAVPSLLYRKWPGQLTAEAAHSGAEERRLRFALIAERAAGLRARLGAPGSTTG